MPSARLPISSREARSRRAAYSVSAFCLAAGLAFVPSGGASAHIRAGAASQASQAYGQFVALKAKDAAEGRLPRLSDPEAKAVFDQLWDSGMLGDVPYDGSDISGLATVTSVEGRVLQAYGSAKPSGQGNDADYQNEVAYGGSFAIAAVADTLEAAAVATQPAIAQNTLTAQQSQGLGKMIRGVTETFVGIANGLDGSMSTDNTRLLAGATARYAKLIAPHMPMTERQKIIAALAAHLAVPDQKTQDDLNQAIADLAAPTCDGLCKAEGQAKQAAVTVPPPGQALRAVAKTTTPAQTANGATASAPTITIPTVQAVGSSVDGATIKAILRGDVAAHADQLAHLDADSIKIPSLTVAWYGGAKSVSKNLIYWNIDLEHVKNGVAETAIVGGTTVSASPLSIKLGRLTVSHFDLGAFLAFYGMGPLASDGAMRTVYDHFELDEGRLWAPSTSCTFGKVTTASMAAKPIKSFLFDMMTMIGQKVTSTASSPSSFAQIAALSANFANTVHMSPIELAGLACSGTDGQGKSTSVAVGNAEIGALAGPRYPQITLKGLNVATSDGMVSLGDVVLKPIDFSRAIDVIKGAAAAGHDDGWFAAHVRDLVPAFGGVSLAGLRMDVPDSQQPGQRVRLSLDQFDLTPSDYLNGLPTRLSSSASGLLVDLPQQSNDKQVQKLIDAGIRRVDIGYDLSANWDKTSNTITVDKLSLSGKGLGSIALSAVLGNAQADLFSDDLQAEQQAAMALTLKQAAVQATDDGLGRLIFARVAQEQNTTAKNLRTKVSGIAQAGILALFGGSPEASQFATALGKFINGASSLSATLTAKQPNGIGIGDLAALQSDPSSLGSEFTVQSSAN